MTYSVQLPICYVDVLISPLSSLAEATKRNDGNTERTWLCSSCSGLGSKSLLQGKHSTLTVELHVDCRSRCRNNSFAALRWSSYYALVYMS